MGAGGKLVYQLAKKKTSHPTCPISGQRLNGVSLSMAGGAAQKVGPAVAIKRVDRSRQGRQQAGRASAAEPCSAFP